MLTVTDTKNEEPNSPISDKNKNIESKNDEGSDI